MSAVDSFPPRYQKVFKLRSDGFSRAEIARLVGMPSVRSVERVIGAINKRLAAAGEPLLCDPGGSARLWYTTERIADVSKPLSRRQAEAADLYGQGMSLHDVGKALKISGERVRQLLGAAGVERRGRGRRPCRVTPTQDGGIIEP